MPVFLSSEGTVSFITASFGRPPLAGPGRVRILVYVSVVVFLSRFPPRILISLRIHEILIEIFKYHDAQLFQITFTSIF